MSEDDRRLLARNVAYVAYWPNPCSRQISPTLHLQMGVFASQLHVPRIAGARRYDVDCVLYGLWALHSQLASSLNA